MKFKKIIQKNKEKYPELFELKSNSSVSKLSNKRSQQKSMKKVE